VKARFILFKNFNYNDGEMMLLLLRELRRGKQEVASGNGILIGPKGNGIMEKILRTLQ
jgi:hypothetical protein